MLYRSVHDARERGKAAVKPFGLLRWFAILGGLAVLLVAVTAALSVARFVERSSIARDAEVMTQFVNNLFQVEQGEGFFLAGAGDGPGDIEEFFQHLSRMPGVLRANAFNRDRRVVWSSDVELVGRQMSENDELEQAFAGSPVAKLDVAAVETLKPEQIALAPAGSRFVENYLPILGDDGRGLPVGVVEIYRVPPGLFASIDAATSRVIWAVGLGAALLYASLFGIVWRGSRLVQTQEARLIAAEKLATAGEMASAVAHGLRNPLASIRSSAELSLSGEPEPEVAAALGEIVDDVDRLESWIRQYLTSARPTGAGNDRADPGQVVRSTVADFASQLRRAGIRAVVSAAETVPQVRLHPMVLRQIVNGLIANAVEAMTRGGNLLINVERAGLGAVRLRIDDDGPGMSPLQLDRALQPFITSKPGGLGLGLPMAREILERHGAELHLESAPGRGTTVELRLPVAQAAR